MLTRGRTNRHIMLLPKLGSIKLSDSEEKQVMDLSNYNSPILVNLGGLPETVLRMGHPNLHHQSSSPSSPAGSCSPQPNRTVITSVSSLQSIPSPSSASSYDHHVYRHSGPQYYYAQSPLSLSQRHQSMSPHQHQMVASSSSSASRRKKSPQPIPEECKDEAYWERRKRNNESAKRSREMRRTKETQTAERVNVLESENLQLRTEVNMLRNEVEKLRQLLIPKSSIAS